jgi:hypothetical protein
VRLDGRAHRAVQDEDPQCEELLEPLSHRRLTLPDVTTGHGEDASPTPGAWSRLGRPRARRTR